VTPDRTFDTALVAEVMRKTAICWVRWLDAAPEVAGDHPVWHAWHDGSAYVLSGDGEQPLPGAGSARAAVVTARTKESRALLISWRAEVSTLDPSDPVWADVVNVLQRERLNLHVPHEERERWARACRVTRLTPTGEIEEAPGRYGDTSGAATPIPTTAVTRGRLPRVLHRRQVRRPDLGQR
jgi:hypothetical protein